MIREGVHDLVGGFETPDLLAGKARLEKGIRRFLGALLRRVEVAREVGEALAHALGGDARLVGDELQLLDFVGRDAEDFRRVADVVAPIGEALGDVVKLFDDRRAGQELQLAMEPVKQLLGAVDGLLINVKTKARQQLTNDHAAPPDARNATSRWDCVALVLGSGAFTLYPLGLFGLRLCLEVKRFVCVEEIID